MQNDGRVISEAPELTNKAMIPERLLEGRTGGGHGAHARPGSPSSDAVHLSGTPKETQAPAVEGNETALQVPNSSLNLGLGEPGLLGQDIITPLEGLATPHPQHKQQPCLQTLTHAPPAYIKPASLAASRGDGRGDLEVPVVGPNETPEPPNMIFSDLYKSPRSPLSKFRHSFPHPVPLPPDLDADLISKDKTKQKEAVKRYLAEKIRNDWEFVWPPVVASPPAPAPAEPTAAGQGGPSQAAEGGTVDANPVPAAAEDEDGQRDSGEEADSESDAESVYSTVSEDALHFRPRAEWTSDLSDNDEPCPAPSPFRFDSPEAVGAAVRTSIESKRAQRRRAVRDEVKWNPGLACFEARRDAWTGAKTVRVKPKPPSPVSPSSPRRLFWRHHRTQSSASQGVTSGSPPAPTSPLQQTVTQTSQNTISESGSAKSAQRTSSHDSAPPVHYPVETLIPLPPPLLPPQNPMRASVQPSMYGSLYDKVIVQSLQPSCPVNLGDMLRACVVGWKRDGEWPPKSMYPTPAPAQTTAAELMAMRQRKAQQTKQKQQQQQQQQANAMRKTASNTTAAAPASASTSRRLSFNFLGGGGGNKGATAASHDPKEKEAKEAGKENAQHHGLRHSLSHSQSHSDEGAGSAGKTLFRRSLQRVLSLGQHGHGHGHSNNGGSVPPSPVEHTSAPSTKEVTAAG